MIVITVPHAKPHLQVNRDALGLPEEEVMHLCDWIAEPTARMLHDKVPNSVLLLGNINRLQADLNRKESRDTAFRKNLDRVLSNGDVKMLIDMHSANGNFFGTEKVTLVEKDIRAWADYQVAGAITGKSVIRMPRTIAGTNLSLVRRLNANGISANIVSAWPTTLDVMSQANEHNVPCVLIEINEEQFQSVDELEQTVNVIADWANELNNQ